jgi:hypothetical protein
MKMAIAKKMMWVAMDAPHADARLRLLERKT